MKRLLIVLWIGCLFACSDETRENPPLKGHSFFRGNPWKFYFIDGDGKDLIHLTPGSSLPTTCIDLKTPGCAPEVIPDNYVLDHHIFVYGNNEVRFDPEKGLNCWTTFVPGNLWITESEFYVMFNRTDVDTIRVHFKFTAGAAVGGDGVAVDIREMYYNNLLIIKNDDYVNGDGIFIQKQDGNRTDIVTDDN